MSQYAELVYNRPSPVKLHPLIHIRSHSHVSQIQSNNKMGGYGLLLLICIKMLILKVTEIIQTCPGEIT